MVAETHTHHDALDPDDVLALLAGHLESVDPATTTIADCGFVGDLGIDDLAAALAEEYGERPLTPLDAEELDDQMTLAELLEALRHLG